MRQRGSFCLITFLLFFLACNHEDYVRDYPQLVSIELKSNTASGVTVEATMSGVHTDQVINHGFVWSFSLKDLVLPSPYSPGISDKSYAVVLGKPDGNTFSTTIESQLISKKKYFLRAFIQTGNTVVYGVPVEFTSLGSDGAAITGVSPGIISPGSVITITGERFGTDATQVKAWIKFTTGDSTVLTVQAVKDTEISALVPTTAIFYNGKVVVSRKGDEKFAYSEIVKGRRAALSGVVVTDVCSSFQLKGANLLAFGAPTSVAVNNMTFYPLPQMTDSTITLPASMHNQTLSVFLSYSSYDVRTTLTDPVPMPAVTNVPSTYSLDNTFVVRGNFPACDLSVYSFDDVALSLSDMTPTQFTVTVSGNTCSAFTLQVLFRNRVIYSAPNRINPPARFDVTSVSPVSGKPGDHVLIDGTGLEFVSVYMDKGYKTPLPTTATPTQIDFPVVVPPGYRVDMNPDGNLNLLFEYCGAQLSSPFHLELLPITITNVLPAISDGTQEITVTGTNFQSDNEISVSLYTTAGVPVLDSWQIRTNNDTSITLFPPRNYTTATGTMVIVISSYGRTITSPTSIQLQ